MFEEFSHPDTLKRPMLKWLLLFLIIILIAAVLVSVFRYNQRNEQSQGQESIPLIDQSQPDMMQSIDAAVYRENVKELFGTIIEVSSSAITVEASIPDAQNTTTITPKTPVFKKQFTLALVPGTTYENKTLPQFAVGDQVRVTTNEPIYTSEAFTAASIAYYDQKAETIKDIVGDTHQIFGTIRSVSGSTFSVEADVVDTNKLGDIDLSEFYVVPYVKKTYQVTLAPDANDPALKAEVMVRIMTEEDIYATQDLAAKEIMILP